LQKAQQQPIDARCDWTCKNASARELKQAIGEALSQR
jgi:hypothetical protein